MPRLGLHGKLDMQPRVIWRNANVRLTGKVGLVGEDARRREAGRPGSPRPPRSRFCATLNPNPTWTWSVIECALLLLMYHNFAVARTFHLNSTTGLHSSHYYVRRRFALHHTERPLLLRTASPLLLTAHTEMMKPKSVLRPARLDSSSSPCHKAGTNFEIVGHGITGIWSSKTSK